MKLVVMDGSAANPGDLSWEPLAALGELTVYDVTPPELSAQRLRGAEAAIINRTRMDGAVFAACPQLRYVGLLATGYNVVDLDAARAHGVTVCNIPAYSTGAVAQYTFALLLELASHVSRHDALVRAGGWQAAPQFCVHDAPLMELSGRTLGLVGYGHIGQAVAKIAVAFGMRVLVCTPHPEKAEPREGVSFADLDTVLASSDVVSLHCPLLEGTRRLIRAETIEKMKDGAMLLNTARGGVVDEADLAAALQRGRLSAAAVDVLTAEPPAGDSPLIGLDNCIVTPHVAWATPEARARAIRVAAENLRCWMEGRPQNVVS